MIEWKEHYQKKFVSADDAARLVKSGDKIAFTSGREAFAVGLALAARKEELKGVRILAPTPTFDFGWYDEGWQDSFEIVIRMPTGTCQEAIDAHRIDFDPSTVIPFVELTDAAKADIVITEVSTPDDNGFCSFGNSLWAKKKQIENAKIVIAEVNKNLIRTFGDNYIHVSQIDYFVEHLSAGRGIGTGSLAGRGLKEPEPYLRTIADNVSKLIKSGDTLQIGVGRTTEPLVRLGLLEGKCDLGWHSEATPPGVISLVREGVINGKYKTVHKGKAVVTSIGGGSREEMEWVNNNPLIWLVDVAYLEDIRVIAAHDNFVAINNALAVDLTGQIAAETIGTRQMSAAGGQIPFVFGSWLSKGGRAISVLPSTAKEGTVSRIMPTLPQGTIVTIQRNCADTVVSEYGVAHLKGKSVRHRAEELIAIAHPDFRTELKKEAKKLFWP
jgi:4-hydroxybutyrate CoA-transferase